MFYEVMEKGVTGENVLTRCPLPPPSPLSAMQGGKRAEKFSMLEYLGGGGGWGVSKKEKANFFRGE